MSAGLIRIALLAWAALAALQIAWHAWLQPPQRLDTTLVLVVALLPLALPLLAFRRGPRRMLLWAGIVALAYFSHGVMEAWAAPAVRGLALAEALLAALLIGALGSVAVVEKRARGVAARAP